jgi:hypothetical protein
MEIKLNDLVNIVSKGLQLNTQELNDMLQDVETIDEVKERISSHISEKSKARSKRDREEAHKRATREVKSATERQLAEAFNLESGNLSETMAALTAKLEKGSHGENKIKTATFDEVLSRDDVQKHFKGLTTQLQQIKDDLQKSERGRKSDEVKWKVKNTARNLLTQLGANLGEGDASEKRLKLFDLALMQNKFGQDENGGIIILDENGEAKRALDALDPTTLNDVVKDSWAWGFEEQKTEPTTPTTHPNKNSFNTVKFGYKADDPKLNDASYLIAQQRAAAAANNQDKVAFYDKQIHELK